MVAGKRKICSLSEKEDDDGLRAAASNPFGGGGNGDVMWLISKYIDTGTLCNLRLINKEFSKEMVYQITDLKCNVEILIKIPNNITILNLLLVVERISSLRMLHGMYISKWISRLLVAESTLDVRCFHMEPSFANQYMDFFQDNRALIPHVSVLDLTNINDPDTETEYTTIDLCRFQQLKSLNMDKCELYKTTLALPLTSDSPGSVCNILHLSAQENRIQSIRGLCEKIRPMRFLNLSYNLIKNITCISYAENLTVLELDGNRIEDASVCKEFKHLEKLSLNHNMIESFDSADSMGSSLQHLSLSNNYLTNVNFMKTMVKLEYVNISDNEISNIDGVEGCKNLRMFRAANNEIETIRGLLQCNHLTVIDLFNNAISEEASSLNHLTELKSLNLADNNLLELIIPDLHLDYLDICDNPMTLDKYVVGSVSTICVSKEHGF